MDRYKTPLLVTLLLALLSFAGTPASAQFLYDNGSGALGFPGIGDFADTGDPNYSMAGDVFTAPTSGTAFVIDFAGIYYNGATPGTPPSTDTFVISLYSTVGGAPDTLISPPSPITLSDLSVETLGLGRTRTIYQFSANLDTPITLTAGTSYYLGITDTTSPYQDFAVAHTAAPGASSNGYSLGTGGFVATGNALAFDLVVPEPSESALIVFGFAGLALARKLRPVFFAGK
jgi:hypothetical protein